MLDSILLELHSNLDILTRVVVATICGLIVGLEREIRHKNAGLKTNTLIAIGSCLFTAVSMKFSMDFNAGDPFRVSSQIVSGIGFLGAGAIIKDGFNVTGLTTAATMWLVAAIGWMCGVGYIILPIIICMCVVLFLLLVAKIFDTIYGGNHDK